MRALHRLAAVALGLLGLLALGLLLLLSLVQVTPDLSSCTAAVVGLGYATAGALACAFGGCACFKLESEPAHVWDSRLGFAWQQWDTLLVYCLLLQGLAHLSQLLDPVCLELRLRACSASLYSSAVVALCAAEQLHACMLQVSATVIHL